jgi:hypothetical protein
MHGSGITALDNLAGEIDTNSQTTFEKLNSQVQSHTSALEKVSLFFLANLWFSEYSNVSDSSSCIVFWSNCFGSRQLAK